MKSKGTWKKYAFEFLSIFIAVVSAFALNNWNENRKNRNSEKKILTEINNGLEKDLEDIRLNLSGHKSGMRACHFFLTMVRGDSVPTDSVLFFYDALTRDFLSSQNLAGYETLKSNGLELIQDDQLRLDIISLYETEYEILRKFEEDYSDMQFSDNYFKDINRILLPHLILSNNGVIQSISQPLQLSENDQKLISIYLIKIYSSRAFITIKYKEVEEKLLALRKTISDFLK